MQRRDFLKFSIAAGTGSFLLGNPLNLFSAGAATPDAVWVSGGEPAQLLNAAFEQFGGLGTFISKGDVVVVKPNMGWDRAPQFAANTNPELISSLVKACFDAGASKVKIFDNTCNNPQRCYRNSQIEAAGKEAGADVQQVRPYKFKEISLPNGEVVKKWPIYQDYMEADKVINVPIAKHHSLAIVTGGLKNLMGAMGGNRGEIHNHFEKKLIDIGSHILPTLTIIDAYRILLNNGPVGGNLNDVKLAKTLIMSPCTVTADYLSLSLFDRKLEEISYLKEAYRRKLNKYDPQNLNLEKVTLS
ncbi:MAG: DUF362 domain-containing protein [Calditrichia bacterium]